MMKSKLPKRRTKAASTVAVLALVVTAWTSVGFAAETATIAIKTPLKSSGSLLGGKTLRQLEPGTLVNVLSTKSTHSQVQLADEPSVKGWVLVASVSKNKDVAAGISNMNSTAKGATDTKIQVAGSMGGVAKGFSNLSPGAQAAASTGKGKSASLKEGIGAVAKGKSGALAEDGRDALEDAVGGDATEGAAEGATAKFKGKSASTLEKIEALKISDSEISGFMKEGGLRSRLIRQ